VSPDRTRSSGTAVLLIF